MVDPRQLLRRIRRVMRRPDPVAGWGHVDAFAAGRASGWAFGDQAIAIEASVDGRVVATLVPDQVRADVAADYPNKPNARTSGLLFGVARRRLAERRHRTA